MNTEQVNQNGDDEAHVRKVDELWDIVEKRFVDVSMALRALFVATFVGYLAVIVNENDAGSSGKVALICFAIFVLSDLAQLVIGTFKAARDFDKITGKKPSRIVKFLLKKRVITQSAAYFLVPKIPTFAIAFGAILTDIWEIL